MKKNLLRFMFIALGGYLWFGNASGPGAVQNLDRTGSPVSPGYCGVSSCHGGGNFGTDVSVQLLNADMEPVLEYTPGEQYKLVVNIAAQGAEGYGFQAVALQEGNEGAGEFGDAGTGTQITTISGRQYFEHSSRSNASSFEIDWTAPAAGNGEITFYAAGNAVNGNFQPSGDQADTTSLKVMESPSSGLYDRIAANIGLEVFPSLAESSINARWSSDIIAERLSIYDLTGKIYYIDQLKSLSPATLNIPVDYLPKGMYFVRLSTPAGFQTQKFVKL